MSQIQLMGGEADGYVVDVREEDCPEIFYAVPLLDEARIQTLPRKERAQQRAERSVLAYRRISRVESPDGVFYRYQREVCSDLVHPVSGDGAASNG